MLPDFPLCMISVLTNTKHSADNLRANHYVHLFHVSRHISLSYRPTLFVFLLSVEMLSKLINQFWVWSKIAQLLHMSR
jgi:hypothetical protein